MASAYKNAGKTNYASYYSGTDIRVYFGDQWVDEIVEIEWSMQEQVAPIYGFASHTWDRIARGTRIVQGSFVTNFKEVGYLQTILNGLSYDMSQSNEWFNLSDFTNGQDPGLGLEEGYTHKDNAVDTLLNNFDSLAEGYENSIWGIESGNDVSKDIDARKKDSFFYSRNGTQNNSRLREKGFNILLTYGNTGSGDKMESSRGKASHSTAQSIIGVQLTGLSQRVDPSGNPVSEVYSFIAKDVSGNIAQHY